MIGDLTIGPISVHVAWNAETESWDVAICAETEADVSPTLNHSPLIVDPS